MKSEKIDFEDFETFDYIIGMDLKNIKDLKTLEAAIDNILVKFGTDFSINFNNEKVSII